MGLRTKRNNLKEKEKNLPDLLHMKKVAAEFGGRKQRFRFKTVDLDSDTTRVTLKTRFRLDLKNDEKETRVHLAIGHF